MFGSCLTVHLESAKMFMVYYVSKTAYNGLSLNKKSDFSIPFYLHFGWLRTVLEHYKST